MCSSKCVLCLDAGEDELLPLRDEKWLAAKSSEERHRHMMVPVSRDDTIEHVTVGVTLRPLNKAAVEHKVHETLDALPDISNMHTLFPLCVVLV